VADLITDIINSIASLVIALAEILEPLIAGEAKDAALQMITQMMQEMPWFDGSGVNIESCISMTVDSIPEEYVGTFVMGLAATEFIPAELGFDQALKATADKISASFEAKADAAGSISSDEAVEILATHFNSFVTEKMTFAAAQAMQFTQFVPGPLQSIDPSLMSDAAQVGIGATRSQLRAGGIKRFVEAIVSFIDVNGDKRISREEMLGLYKAFAAFRKEPTKETLTALVRAAAGLFDRNSDGVIDNSDLIIIADKLVELVYSVFYLAVNLVKYTSTAMVLPVLNIAFAQKAAMIGGSSSSLTKEEVDKALSTLLSADGLAAVKGAASMVGM